MEREGKTVSCTTALRAVRAVDQSALSVWPGCAGRASQGRARRGSRASGAAGAALIIITGDFGNASRQAGAIAISRWSAGWHPLPW